MADATYRFEHTSKSSKNERSGVDALCMKVTTRSQNNTFAKHCSAEHDDGKRFRFRGENNRRHT
jgi:hypothetical protein